MIEDMNFVTTEETLSRKLVECTLRQKSTNLECRLFDDLTEP